MTLQVKSDIVDNYNSLIREGYSSIIGIRDVYPIERAKIEDLRRGLKYFFEDKTNNANFYFICDGDEKLGSWQSILTFREFTQV